jgi:hypothetical protein
VENKFMAIRKYIHTNIHTYIHTYIRIYIRILTYTYYRLEELVVQLAGVAKVIGNTDLEEKFMAASKMMKRDIVFAASLYL